ncbi:MAG TPA: Sir2 family NAD-dependent protein deacetylase [Actinomycetota bacterium]|nr:Sir2 family NAD-dependent protein deacetylase [Actinomycetota bacterium]
MKLLLGRKVPEVALDGLVQWLKDAASIVILTGAGISTESGIPDFRGPQGVWTKDPESEKLSNIHYYMADPEIRQKAWRARLEHPVWKAKPNPAHIALAELERKVNLERLITQNIDGLHQMAGSSPAVLIELHGTMWEVICMGCGERGPMGETLKRVEAGEEDPPCHSCGGILKSATVSFGQSLDQSAVDAAASASAECDVFLAVGTSHTVYPAAQLPELAIRGGAKVGIFNAERTPLDAWADFRSEQSLAACLPEIVGKI